MNRARYQSLPLFTCFSYKSGPLHLINPAWGLAYCGIDANPKSPLDQSKIKRYHQPRSFDTKCINCTKIQNSRATSASDLPDIPDAAFLTRNEYHQSLSEYSMSNQSAFDPSSFLDASIAEPTTRRPPLPPGDYIGTIDDIKMGEWVKKDDSSKRGMKFDAKITVEISDAATQAAVGASTVVFFHGVFLDTTPAGGLDNAPGKNSGLRKYRDALNMNKPGETFAIRQMIGRQLRVKIAHEIYQGEAQDKIDAVAKV